MSVSPQDSEPIRLSSEDERVDQSGASNNGKKICFEFALCGAERDHSVVRLWWKKRGSHCS